MNRIQFYPSQALADILNAEAAANGVSVSKFVVDLLDGYYNLSASTPSVTHLTAVVLGEIEDFLTYIGASQAALSVMNAKIVKDFRSGVNRQVNCDTANIEKQLSSSKRVTDAIALLEKNGAFSRLPDTLQTSAILRRDNPQLSLAELAAIAGVTKSGMKHRMEKLVAAAEECMERKTEDGK